MLTLTHHGAVKCADRNTPPERRTERSTSDSGSIVAATPQIWTNDQMIRSPDHSRQAKGSVLHYRRDGGGVKCLVSGFWLAKQRLKPHFPLALALCGFGDIAAQHVVPTIGIAGNFRGERHEGGGDVSRNEGPDRYAPTMRTRSQNATHAAWECFC